MYYHLHYHRYQNIKDILFQVVDFYIVHSSLYENI